MVWILVRSLVIPPDTRDSFFGALDYGDTHDSISDALGVIADAKYESALIARFAGESSGIEQSMDLSAYAGLSGSVGDDVLIGWIGTLYLRW